MLFLLWAAFFLNQADRQVFSVVLPLIRVDLGLSDAQSGLIASTLVWTYGLLVPLAGWAGDRMSRRNIIVVSLLFWSAATLLTGMSTTLLEFILLRGLATGGGEAFYAPAANALISEEHAKKQSTALAVHQSAVYFGIVASGVIAGYIGQHYGWRKSFYVFGGAGIAVAVVILSVLRRDLPLPTGKGPGHRLPDTARQMLRTPTALLLTAAFGCMVFVNVGYLTWMPSLLVEKFGQSLAAAGFNALFYHHLGAFLGVILGGSLADKLSRVFAGNRLAVQATALLAGAPFIYWIGSSETVTGTYIALFLFGVFRGCYDSNIFASLYEVVAPSMRASAAGLMLMGAFLSGAFAPYLLGLLKPVTGLARGLSWLWVSYCIGGLCIGVALLRFFRTDALKKNEHAIEYSAL